MATQYLSVDLGGTSLRMALLDRQANIFATETLNSDRVREPSRLAPEITALATHLGKSATAPIGGLAMGIPGLIDSERGIAHRSPHFPLWKDVKLREVLETKIKFPIIMDNDANQAALGEAWKGAGRKWKNFVLITLGTGIGSGIILDGNVFRGPSGFAGEVGHIVIERGGRDGVLGSEGTLEALASQSGLKTLLKKTPIQSQALDAESWELPKKLYDLARAGNAEAAKLWEDFGKALGCGIASIAHTLGAFHFVIGGGLGKAWDQFGNSCLEEARRRSYDFTASHLEIVPAELDDQAGLIGGVRSLLDRGL